MTFNYDKTLRLPFNLTEALMMDAKVVTASGNPVKIVMHLSDVHHCSAVIFKWAQLDINGRFIAWHISTATPDGMAQLGSAHRLYMYAGQINLAPSELEIW